MINITDVDAFTAPVTVLQDGDPVSQASTVATIQALSNRTYNLKLRLDVDYAKNTAGGVIGLDSNKHAAFTASGGNASALTGTGNGSGAGLVGVGGTSAGNYGVMGTGGGTNGTGVYGQAVGDQYGVFGVATFGNSSSVGVYAKHAGNGTAFYAEADGSGTAAVVTCSLGTGPTLSLFGNTTIAPIRTTLLASVPSGASNVGDMYVTTAGVLKICTVAGTGGAATWVSVGAQV